MIKKQLSVFLENKNGQLSEITGVLADNNVNLMALNIAETADYGVLRLIVDDERKAAAVLSENDFILSVNPVEMIAVPNKPGGLHALLNKMSDAGIGVEYMYSIFGQADGQAYMIFKVDNPEKLEEIAK